MIPEQVWECCSGAHCQEVLNLKQDPQGISSKEWWCRAQHQLVPLLGYVWQQWERVSSLHAGNHIRHRQGTRLALGADSGLPYVGHIPETLLREHKWLLGSLQEKWETKIWLKIATLEVMFWNEQNWAIKKKEHSEGTWVCLETVLENVFLSSGTWIIDKRLK